MLDSQDPREKEKKDMSEEMMLAEALYLYERDLEGELSLDTEE